MFNSFTGIITEKSLTHIAIETHGIEWSVEVASSTLNLLPPVGESAKVYLYLVHAENLMALYGFSSKDERNIFLQLLKVDGIGPKAAIKILSNISYTDLTTALESGEVSSLEKIPGIGKKTAAKMILALKGKLELPSDENPKSKTGEYFAVVQSLVSMGYDRKNCEQIIASLTRQLNSEETWKNLKPTEKEDMLFRKALIELAN